MRTLCKRITTACVLVGFVGQIGAMARPPTRTRSTIEVAAASVAFGYMYWTDSDGGRILRAHPDSSVVLAVVTGLDTPFAIALDTARGKMYWSDRGTDKIQRADLDGFSQEDLVTGSSVTSLALDVEAGKMYWTGRPTDANPKIQRANLDGSNIEDLITGGLASPRGITVHSASGKIYWSDGGTHRIHRANLDGTGAEAVVVTDFLSIGALTIGGGKVYWTSVVNPALIQRSNLDGSAVETLDIQQIEQPSGLAVDVPSGKIYWAQRENHAIHRANLDGSQAETIITQGAAIGRPQDLALVLPRDCNGNGVSDDQDVLASSSDCNTNGVPDECEPDCNTNNVPDGCDLSDATSTDCNANLIPDECEPDCNNNGIADGCDIKAMTSADCTANGIPDECEPDCNNNDSPDSCDIADNTSTDCNTNDVPDACEVADGTAPDSNGNGVPDVCETKMYWMDRILDKVQRANRDGSGVEDVVTSGLSNPRHLAVDIPGQKMYWTDTGADDIKRANVDGSGVETLIAFGPDSGAWGIELDTQAGKMYWMLYSSPVNKIQRANLDGSDVEDVVSIEGSIYGTIVLDVARHKVYWAEWRDSIRRANFDGTEIEDVVRPVVGGPSLVEINDMALDVANDTIYWVARRSIKRARLGTADIEDVVTHLGGPISLEIDPVRRKMYWVDTFWGTIHRANLDGSEIENLVLEGLRQPSGLALGTGDADCNNNGISDVSDIANGISGDCNANRIPDECDIAENRSVDCDGINGNGVPDECEPDCNNNGLADDCDLANGTSDDCNNNGRPDDCEPDCNANLVADECDIRDGTSQDTGGDGVPDECSCLIPSPVNSGDGVAKNRYLSFDIADARRIQAIQIELGLLSPPFAGLGGIRMWVGPPAAISEAGGVVDPADAPSFSTFMAATLQCEPFFTDWSAHGTVHVYHEVIVPGSSYTLLAFDPACGPGDLDGIDIFPPERSTSMWGDVTGWIEDGRRLPPDGRVDIVSDVLGVLNAFSNRPAAISKTSVDLAPALLDHKIQILDAVMAIDAFRGLPYPFEPSGVPCGE